MLQLVSFALFSSSDVEVVADYKLIKIIKKENKQYGKFEEEF